MKRLSCDLHIGKFRMNYVHSISIKSSWKELTDTATIKLPANLKFNREQLKDLLKTGDVVKLNIGYDDNPVEVFAGYISSVNTSVPLEIECENEMFMLKQNSITDTLENATVSDLMAKHFSAYKTEVLDAELSSEYQIPGWSQAKILENLKENYGLNSYFRGGKLFVGKVYSTELAKTVNFKFQHNIIKDDLEWRRAEDVKIKVVAISNNPDGSKTEIEVGDNDGERHTLNFYDLSKSELEKAAMRKIDKLKYDGFSGGFQAFGEPFTQHSDIVKLSHPEKSDRTGSYFVDSVEYSFGVNGYRQKIKLGKQA